MENLEKIKNLRKLLDDSLVGGYRTTQSANSLTLPARRPGSVSRANCRPAPLGFFLEGDRRWYDCRLSWWPYLGLFAPLLKPMRDVECGAPKSVTRPASWKCLAS